MGAECATVRQALGVYVLGPISPAERALVKQHLAVCRPCRDELAGLAGPPDVLGRLNLEQAERTAGNMPPATRDRP